MYQLKKYSISDQINHVENLDNGSIIPFDPDNTDYQNFKAQINDESAQLEDVDGVLMSPEAAKAYVATLP
jgi:hypothetical protein